ncbi:Acetyltransferase (GNAT) family protein [Enterobacter sp. NFR05]|uniref:GNAT family N-acetyltransferase n=1 Tax=Citrobacter sp. UYEF32 TaxID=3156347 RepID=UPI0009A63C87|nr:Acetyltransferase (GNAT) family protein [Enterobacter sp. NFR05]
MLTICQAQVNNAELLHDMAYASYTHHFAHLWQNKDELANFLAQEYALPVLQQSLQDEGCCWLIAASDGIPVGFAKFSWHAAASPQGPSGTLLHKLYFLPQATGKGYGEGVIQEVTRRAREHGERFLWLEVLDANPQARRFYERQGFEHVRDTVFSTASQQSTLHILGKVI